MKEELKKPMKELNGGPDYEAPKKRVGKMPMKEHPEKGGRQGHPAKRSQPLDMKFLD